MSAGGGGGTQQQPAVAQGWGIGAWLGGGGSGGSAAETHGRGRKKKGCGRCVDCSKLERACPQRWAGARWPGGFADPKLYLQHGRLGAAAKLRLLPRPTSPQLRGPPSVSASAASAAAGRPPLPPPPASTAAHRRKASLDMASTFGPWRSPWQDVPAAAQAVGPVLRRRNREALRVLVPQTKTNVKDYAVRPLPRPRLLPGVGLPPGAQGSPTAPRRFPPDADRELRRRLDLARAPEASAGPASAGAAFSLEALHLQWNNAREGGAAAAPLSAPPALLPRPRHGFEPFATFGPFGAGELPPAAAPTTLSGPLPCPGEWSVPGGGGAAYVCLSAHCTCPAGAHGHGAAHRQLAVIPEDIDGRGEDLQRSPTTRSFWQRLCDLAEGIKRKISPPEREAGKHKKPRNGRRRSATPDPAAVDEVLEEEIETTPEAPRAGAPAPFDGGWVDLALERAASGATAAATVAEAEADTGAEPPAAWDAAAESGSLRDPACQVADPDNLEDIGGWVVVLPPLRRTQLHGARNPTRHRERLRLTRRLTQVRVWVPDVRLCDVRDVLVRAAAGGRRAGVRGWGGKQTSARKNNEDSGGSAARGRAAAEERRLKTIAESALGRHSFDRLTPERHRSGLAATERCCGAMAAPVRFTRPGAGRIARCRRPWPAGALAPPSTCRRPQNCQTPAWTCGPPSRGTLAAR